MEWGNYRGDRLRLYTYNNICSEGEAIFTKFIYESSDEAAVVNVFGKSLVPDMIADASIIEHN